MRPYLAILRARFLALLQYRVAAAAGLVTQVFWGFIRMMVFVAFFRAGAETGVVAPMPLADVITYVWLGQAMILLLPFRPEAEVDALIRSGNVAFELLRPVDQYTFWYARSLAARVAPTVLRATPLVWWKRSPCHSENADAPGWQGSRRAQPCWFQPTRDAVQPGCSRLRM